MCMTSLAENTDLLYRSTKMYLLTLSLPPRITCMTSLAENIGLYYSTRMYLLTLSLPPPPSPPDHMYDVIGREHRLVLQHQDVPINPFSAPRRTCMKSLVENTGQDVPIIFNPLYFPMKTLSDVIGKEHRLAVLPHQDVPIIFNPFSVSEDVVWHHWQRTQACCTKMYQYSLTLSLPRGLV